MPDNELHIRLLLETLAATAADEQFHSSARQRAQETAAAQKKIQREFLAGHRAALKEADSADRAFHDASRQRQTEDLAKRKSQLNELKAAIQQRYAHEDIIARDASRANTRQAREDLSSRKAELSDLKDAILKRHAASDQAAKDSARTMGHLRTEERAERNLTNSQIADAARTRLKLQNEESSGVKTLIGAYAGFRVATVAVDAVRTAMQLTAEEAERTRDHIKEMVESMRAQRDQLVEVSYLRGEKPTGAGAAAFARRAGQLGIASQDLRKGEETFLAESAMYVAPAGFDFEKAPAAEKARYKVSKPQSEKLLNLVLPYAIGIGVKADDASKMLATILQTEPVDPKTGRVDDEKVLTEFAQMMQSAIFQPGKTSPQLAQLSRVLKETQLDPGTRGDWADIGSVLAQFVPESEHMYTRNFLQGITKLEPEQRDELGISPKDAPRDQVKKLLSAWEKEEATGDEQGTVRTFMHQFFPNIRAETAVMQLTKAESRGDFERVKKSRLSKSAADVRRGAQERIESEPGQDAAAKAFGEASEATAGARNRNLILMREHAKELLLQDPATFERSRGLGEIIYRKARQFYGEGDDATQMQNDLVQEQLRKELRGFADQGSVQARQALLPFTEPVRDPRFPFGLGKPTPELGDLGDRLKHEKFGETFSEQQLSTLANVLAELKRQTRVLDQGNPTAPMIPSIPMVQHR